MLSRSYKADLALVLVVVIWGATFALVQKAIEEIPVHSFHVLRFGIATLALLPIYLFRKHRNRSTIPAPRGLLLKAGFLAGLSLWLGYSFQTFGLLHTTPAHSGFLTGMAVVIVPLLAFLLLKEKLEKRVIIGISMAASGLALLAFGGQGTIDQLPPEPDIAKGDLLTFGCATAFAFQIIVKAHWASKLSALQLTIVELTTVFFLSLLAATMLEEFPDLETLSSTVWSAVLLTGLLATAFAFLVQSWAQRTTTAVHTAVIFAFEPVTAAFFSWWLIGEVLTPWAAIGGILIIGGMLRTELRGSNKKTAEN
ncbi:MAG: DMT family transporter [Planctomycetota bacterium]